MLREPTDVAVGGTCFLFPHTRTASTNVHRMLTVKVLKDPKVHWPMVVVGWTDQGVEMWELVHKDDIRLRSPAARDKVQEKQGDTVGDGGEVKTKVRRMPGRAIGLIEGQETLF